jgi:hypothetical protein
MVWRPGGVKSRELGEQIVQRNRASGENDQGRVARRGHGPVFIEQSNSSLLE